MGAPHSEAETVASSVLRAALDAMPLGVAVIDADGRAAYANALAAELLGEGVAAPLEALPPDGSLRATSIALPGDAGLTLLVLTAVASVDDVDLPREPAKRLAAVEAIAQLGSWTWDIPTNVVTWSDELYRIYGLAPQSVPMTYETFLERVHPDDRTRVAETVERCFQSGEAYVFTHRSVWPDGTVRWHQGRGQAVMEGGQATRMFGMAQDVTDSVRTEQALRDSLREARELASENARLRTEVEAQLRQVRASRARIVEAADDARRQLERDLHDGAQQRLTTVGLILRTAQADLPPGADSTLVSAIDSAVDELQAGLADLRSLARGLHPAILTDEGLVPALRTLVARCPIAVEFSSDPLARLSPQVEAAAYFVVSEALTNVVKHAQARRTMVTVNHRGDRLVVEVQDDGVGGAMLEGRGGLRGLSDRVAALNGQLDVSDPAGGGTSVRAELPCV